MTLFVTTIVVIPVWLAILSKIGKRNTFFCGVALVMPFYLLLYFAPENLSAKQVHLIFALGGVAIGNLYLLPWSMLPNVIDDAHLALGVRFESIYFSFFVFFQKFAVGATLGLSTVALDVAGYITDPCCDESQPKAVSNTLRLLLGGVPSFLALISLIGIFFYPLTTAREAEIKAKLDVAVAAERVPGLFEESRA
eukprot:m.215329 g.215329  ORF g.215329 m.215329 type:complete len:195 (+) comp10777_c0_seq12:1119-1703(+)